MKHFIGFVVLTIFFLTGCASTSYKPPVEPPSRTMPTPEPLTDSPSPPLKPEKKEIITYYSANYDISLSEVERPAKAKERYGEQKIEKVQEEGKKSIFNLYYKFEDEMVKILWIMGSPSIYEISFVLNNKTDYSIKIVWDEASFVDEKGVSHRVMHSGVKYADRNNPQPPTVIVRKSSYEDLIFPTDYVYLEDRDWKKQPLLSLVTDFVYIDGEDWLKRLTPPGVKYERDERAKTLLLFRGIKYWTFDEAEVKPFLSKLNSYVGTVFQVLLPLQIEDVVNDYIFTFKVTNVDLTSKTERLY